MEDNGKATTLLEEKNVAHFDETEKPDVEDGKKLEVELPKLMAKGVRKKKDLGGSKMGKTDDTESINQPKVVSRKKKKDPIKESVENKQEEEVIVDQRTKSQEEVESVHKEEKELQPVSHYVSEDYPDKIQPAAQVINFPAMHEILDYMRKTIDICYRKYTDLGDLLIDMGHVSVSRRYLDEFLGNSWLGNEQVDCFAMLMENKRKVINNGALGYTPYAARGRIDGSHLNKDGAAMDDAGRVRLMYANFFPSHRPPHMPLLSLSSTFSPASTSMDAMADWFVGPVMDKLINACSDYLQDHFRRQTGMKEELERLRVNHPMIQAVVSAYTQGKIADRNLKSWLWQLRDAIDEADDVLDDFEYMKHEEQLELNMEETKVRSSFNRLFLVPARKLRRVCERALKIDPNWERLEEAVQKLDRVSAQVNTFLHLVEKKEKEQQVKDQQVCDDRASGSFPGPVFIGREQEGKPSDHNLSLLSVVGHGGMGKTTLLQNIFADDITKEFDLKIWVCVSHNFEVEKVITDMLKYLDEWSSHLTILPPLQERLNSVTRSKKFLLVLDDIWEENTTKWEKVISPLAYGKLGSKILVTTRIHAAASMIPDMIIENKETLTLKGLQEAQCLELLKTHAFAGMENFSSEHKKLMSIAEEIVKKLSGSPLATKVIGGVLKYDLTPEHWQRISNSDKRVLVSNIGRVELVPGLNTNPIMPILRFSFTYLPQSLQICFAFCGIFSKDHRFDKDDLVRMWIALGFFRDSCTEGETLVDIGGKYFDVLVRKSFFDKFQYYKRIYYKMHDLLHDLAQSVSSDECFRFMGDDVLTFKIPKTIRHLYVKTENLDVLRMIKEAKKLRSLFLFSQRSVQDFTEILDEIFEASRKVHLLVICSHFEKLSEAIKNLRHLRYLNFTGSVTQMPRSLSSLYHLQFIIIMNVVEKPCLDDFLPIDVSNLSNLRHVDLPSDVFSSVPGIGKLRSLQELNEFNVKNENGYRIGELEHLSELRKLKIHFLENVKDAGEAHTAKLFEKRKLTSLFLNWGKAVGGREIENPQNIINSDLDVNVLENLKPYKNLKKLSIVSCKGLSCAKWMYDADLISNLEHISLNGCSEWETLSPFGQLPHLKSLYLCDMPKVKQLDNKFRGNNNICVFPALEVLHMKGLQLLEDLFDKAGAATDECFFPCLMELFLHNCPKLQELRYLPPKLKKMQIHKVGWKAALNCKKGSNNCCGISKSIPLESLEVLSCPNITSLLQADVRLEALRILRIEGCPNLISLGGLQQVESGAEKSQLILSEFVIDEPSLLPTVSITSLEKLKICNNDLLVSFTVEAEQWFLHVSSSLRELSFEGLKSLQSLPSSLGRLSSLKILRVQNVPQFQQLLHIPASLEELYLQYLESLQRLPTSLSTISSLNRLELKWIPLKSLPELPPSLNTICLEYLESLQCLPSSLSAISSLNHLRLVSIPLLKSLPDLPSSLSGLYISNLDNLQCLPSSLSAISSLNYLQLVSIPLLKSLPDLPSFLNTLSLHNLNNLQCLPSSFSAISSLNHLHLFSIPLLISLPDLPSSLHSMTVKNCHPQLMKRYKKISGSNYCSFLFPY
ncbi:putative disease resistance protein RGA3 [Phalaenopsis equestris]|uniref:putative disease resistance protein RGA3 n=1 Tax=Phalaenopsis equestris TaxID=78828 RepID=UPI0009E6349A|nr:putative disease resistance protein RGA3 [Phalaenopsis equestris]